MESLRTENFFQLEAGEWTAPLFESSTYPWEILASIGSFILDLGSRLPSDLYEKREGDIWIARSARLSDYVTLEGPAIIGERVQVRPGAYIRGRVLVGPDSVVGNSTEIKNALLLGRVEVPHFNYIGDSILSYGAHLGAGVITSNLRSDRQNIKVRLDGQSYQTSLRKLGAMISEGVEVGCNTVLNPGVMLGRGAVIYPLSSVRVSVPAGYLYKSTGDLVPIEAD